jgi:GR25 family glycosyltransferase involved in LPS biosynthesis
MNIPIVYINLESRTDRREHMESQLARYGLEATRFNAVANPGFGIWGCGQSHLAVLKMAQSNGWPQVWILEDDFEFLLSPDEIRERLASLPDFDVFMAAYNMRESSALVDEPEHAESFCRVEYAHTASSYMIKSHYYQKLIDLYEDALPKLLSTKKHWIYANDAVWRDLQKSDRWIAPINRWGKQMDGYSDNAQSVVQYDC